MKKVKLWFCGVAAALSVTVVGQTAQAGAIVGSESLSGFVSLADRLTDLNTDAGVTLRADADQGGTGDFSNISPLGPIINYAFFDTSPVSFTVGSSLTISDPKWGTFTGVEVFSSRVPGQVNLGYIGTFTPGTGAFPNGGSYPAGVTANGAVLLMAFTQSAPGKAGNPQSISDSMSLTTPAPSTHVPEPGSFAILGTMLGLVALVGGARRFRRRAN